MVHRNAGFTKNNRSARFVKAQQIKDRMFTVTRRNVQGTIFNIDMLFRVSRCLQTQCVSLKVFCKLGNRFWDGGRKHQGAAVFGGLFQDEFQIFAKAKI